MELVNIFLETDTGRVKFSINNTESVCVSELINKFVELLSEYIHIDQSEFYLVLKDKDIFYFKCDRGSISIVNNEFYVFDESLLFVKDFTKVTGIEFIVTESMPTRIVPKNDYAVISVVTNHKFYDGLSL
ncbi:virion core protein [Raccoonpox virus]|uniref:Core protein OPG073 n=1 Tax=Raccoon poxvirus TaxID=10256 RepID=A0A0G3FXL6_RACVI|nr:Virion core protein [Raccoonpox virus]AKJ93695.1 Virion core protein [Raccoonpox virus]AOP31327.1 virion core protein [Raccoonpox virus]